MPEDRPSSGGGRRRFWLLVVLAGVLGVWSSQIDVDDGAGSVEVLPDSSSESIVAAPRVLVTPTGLVVEILGGGPGDWRVRTPCNEEAIVTDGNPVSKADVVIDPGHGGEETGAVGANGLAEKDLNLAVAEQAVQALDDRGFTAVLTRTADYRMTVASRVAIAVALRPAAFISVHHNGDPNGHSELPGTETFYQADSPDSRRLGGLIYEEILAVFSQWPETSWHGNIDAGAKYRLDDQGEDFFGVLRLTGDVTSVMSEGLFLSAGPEEAELLARTDVQQAEGSAIAEAFHRFLLTDDPGVGYVEPIPRGDSDGGGGGEAGCDDPPME